MAVHVTPTRVVMARSLLADASDATLTARLPSLVKRCAISFSCDTARISEAIAFGFTLQNDDPGFVGLIRIGIFEGDLFYKKRR